MEPKPTGRFGVFTLLENWKWVLVKAAA